MNIKREYEIFGRKIDFEDMGGIKKVFQPGMLDLSYFFNPTSLKNSVSELCGYGSKEILVYFREIEDINILSDNRDNKRNWWNAFQTFVPLVQNFPAGCEVEYFYGPKGEARSCPEFKENVPPYQAYVNLFGKAIQGFSCFVNQNPNQLSFSSWTYSKPDGSLADEKTSLWRGNSDVFLESATILHNAFSGMKRRGYTVGKETMAGNRRREVRIIYPERGALVGSLCGKDSITLFIENGSLEKLVQQDRRNLRVA